MPRYYSVIHDELKVKTAVINSCSISEVLQKLGLSPSGGNYISLKQSLLKLGISIKHFTGQGYLKSKSRKCWRRPLTEVLIKGKIENTHNLRKRLIAEGYKELLCERCYLTDWLGEPIPLELHHIDGDRFNNSLDNLSLLCPNCHAKTKNYRGRNKVQ